MMTTPPTRALRWLPLLAALGGCAGIDAGVDYPDGSDDYEQHLRTPEGDSDPSVSLGAFKIAPEACQGLPTQPVVQTLTPDDLARFLEKQGVKVTLRKARENLYWFDFPNGDGGFVRLRLAVLPSPAAAGKDLHASLLDHGPGWWGVRRGNLAVLAPKAGLGDAVGFAMRNKLVCWGVFTYAGVDDAYVVPGPYSEL
jgi:hypothetical protein